MPRCSPLTSACALVVSFGLLGAGAATGVTAASAARTPVATVETTVEEPDPLTVRIEEMTPAVLTGDGPVEISGTVTNASEETWTEINLAPFRSATPITDSATLNAAAQLPDDAYVGDRVTDVRALHKVEELAPGESAPFTTTIPRIRLGRSPGVYWVGVHARGVTDTQPRDLFTDGRARTFLPVTSRASAPLPTAVVLPVRLPVEHTADGRIDRTGDWAQMLAPDGELDALLGVARASADRQVTWLLDPAVPHAVARLAAGNPAWTLDALPTEPTESAEPEDELAPDETTAPVLPSPTGDPAEGDDLPPDALVEDARAWLAEFTDLMGSAEVLSLPYGDIDVSAVAESRPGLVGAAWTRSQQVLEAMGIDSTPVVAPPRGFLTERAVQATADDGIVLLGEDGLADGDGPTPTTGSLLGHDFATASAGISAGGPGPESPATPVAVRQRVVSEAVLRDLAGDPDPLVVSPPADWDPAQGSEALFAALSARRFRVVDLPSLIEDSDGPTLGSMSLVRSRGQLEDPVPRRTVRSAVRLVGRASLLESVLTNPAGFDAQVRDAALTELSHHAKRRPEEAVARLLAGREHVDTLLSSISITGPRSATLSGESGTIGTTVTNGLQVPVTVNVEVDAASDFTVDVPNPVAIAPDSRRRLLLDTSSGREGVQSLTLRVTADTGQPLGGELTVQVRASEVSGLLWLIMGTGAVVLFGAIAVRWFRRGLSVRGKQGLEPTTDE